MPFKIVIVPKAKEDLISAVAWYEEKQYNLGKRFQGEIIKTIDSLNNPVKYYGPVYRGLSRVFVKQFPYVLYFKKDISTQCITVFAILHEKQDKISALGDR
ncbi:MAG: type II toxin-antitoxin system RelE/ParE family toxin [Chitinophagaceae bacterium]